MKAFWNALAIVLVINMLLVLGGIGYLRMTGRLNADRVRAVAAVFRTTIEEEQARELQAAEESAIRAERERRQFHQQKVADGPVSTREQIGRDQEAEELALLQVQRLREEIRALQRQLETARRALAAQKADQEAKAAAWEASIADELARRENEDFQKTILLYQQVKPRQAKDMFLQLIAEGRRSQVVEYLAAMQSRKAAAVLKEFKTPEELAVASDLLEQLRQRGAEMLDPATSDGSMDDSTVDGSANDAGSRSQGGLG